MVNFSAICDTRRHCQKCRTNPGWRKAFGAPEVCPFGVQALPPITKRISNLAKAGVSEAKAILNGKPPVTPEQKQKRLAVCATCEFRYVENGKDDRCSKCGCYLKAKTNWRTSFCPIHKWEAIDIP